MGITGVKVAVMVLLQSTGRNVGLVAPVTAPLQLEKVYPIAGIASRVTVEYTALIVITAG